MRSLLLMRHAKSDWDADFASDQDRPLNQRGVRSALVMGRLLASLNLAPQHIITSSATRARRTAELANEAGQWGCVVVVEPRLYSASPQTVVEVASRAPDVERLMLVGHQPTWSSVVNYLSGEAVEMKTATIAVIEFDIADWSGVLPGGGQLVDVHVARDHLGDSSNLG